MASAVAVHTVASMTRPTESDLTMPSPDAAPSGASAADFAELADASAYADRLSSGIAARPVARVLPLARWIPQDVHSVLDYASALTLATAGIVGRDPAACVTGWTLAASGAAVSAVTDDRLSLAKLLPIEVHEIIDHVRGLSAVALPFLLGFHRRSRLSTVLSVVAGVSTVLASLVTDYRAQRGISWTP